MTFGVGAKPRRGKMLGILISQRRRIIIAISNAIVVQGPVRFVGPVHGYAKRQDVLKPRPRLILYIRRRFVPTAKVHSIAIVGAELGWHPANRDNNIDGLVVVQIVEIRVV